MIISQSDIKSMLRKTSYVFRKSWFADPSQNDSKNPLRKASFVLPSQSDSNYSTR